MATVYPLTLPTVTGVQSVSLRTINAVSHQRSPFTFAGQAQAFAGQMWGADVTLPPMKRSEAAVWVSWLTSLRGQFGTFLMGDPLCRLPQGSALTLAADEYYPTFVMDMGTDTYAYRTDTALTGDAVQVDGANQTGEDLNVMGFASSQTGVLLAGDYVQLGSGSSASLHQVLSDVDSDITGRATLQMWPHVRTAPSDGASVIIDNPVGRWRLADNQQSWSIDQAAVYGISFSAVEAI